MPYSHIKIIRAIYFVVALVAALMGHITVTDCVMRVEREAALKNDVFNLLRNQRRQPEGLADLLLDVVASKQCAPVIIDYCIQHLGAMVGSISDNTTKARIRETSVCHRTYIYQDGHEIYNNEQ